MTSQDARLISRRIAGSSRIVKRVRRAGRHAATAERSMRYEARYAGPMGTTRLCLRLAGREDAPEARWGCRPGPRANESVNPGRRWTGRHRGKEFLPHAPGEYPGSDCAKIATPDCRLGEPETKFIEHGQACRSPPIHRDVLCSAGSAQSYSCSSTTLRWLLMNHFGSVTLPVPSTRRHSSAPNIST